MLIAVQKNEKINAVLIDNRQACEMIARAIGRELDGQPFNILEEVLKPVDQPYMSFKDLSPSEFFNARHRKHITRDPLHRFDEVITYEAYDYIFFNLDAHTITVPDFNDHESEFMLHESKELHSNYEAYKHAMGIIGHNKPMQFALANNFILVQPTNEHHSLNDTLIRDTFSFRENKEKSTVVNMDYCYCCGTFECACTESELEEFSKGLPF